MSLFGIPCETKIRTLKFSSPGFKRVPVVPTLRPLLSPHLLFPQLLSSQLLLLPFPSGWPRHRRPDPRSILARQSTSFFFFGKMELCLTPWEIITMCQDRLKSSNCGFSLALPSLPVSPSSTFPTLAPRSSPISPSLFLFSLVAPFLSLGRSYGSFCRFISPILFCGPDTGDPGDLTRWARLGVYSCGFVFLSIKNVQLSHLQNTLSTCHKPFRV